MRIGLLLGWGIVLYAIAFLEWSIFAVHEFTDGTLPSFIGFSSIAFTALLAGASLKFRSWKDILPYSMAWMLMFVIFDVLATPLPESDLHANIGTWMQYALITCAPLLAPVLHFDKYSIDKWET